MAGSPILVISQPFYPELVSTGQTLTELLEALAARGYDITVIAAQPTLVPGSKKVPWYIEHAGLRIHRAWSTRFPKTRAAGKLSNLITFFISASLRVLWSHQRDHLILQSNPPFLPMLGWFVNLIRGQTFGVLWADVMPEQAELLHFIRPNGVVARLWRRANHLWLGRASYAVVFNREMKEGAVDNANYTRTPRESIARDRIHVIPLWADLAWVKPMPKSRSTEAARLGVGDKLVVQYSGNHGRFHDLETLVGTAAGFGESDGVEFQFIGEGQKKPFVAGEAAKPGRRHFRVSGYVPREKLADSLAMADLGVVAQLPGQERVCHPSKLLGIAASGRAVLAICPPDCELAELVRTLDLGWVVPNGDVETGRRAILEALADRGKVARCGENCATFAASRGLDAIVPLYESLILSATGHNDPSANHTK
jgi:glycosyltransferase involved in cell wall biosynthesis